MIKLNYFKNYEKYEDYYNDVVSYADTKGKNGTGIMIPSWRAIKEWFKYDCKMNGNKIITRRVITEEFDEKNSGIVKVDICYRI